MVDELSSRGASPEESQRRRWLARSEENESDETNAIVISPSRKGRKSLGGAHSRTINNIIQYMSYKIQGCWGAYPYGN